MTRQMVEALDRKTGFRSNVAVYNLVEGGRMGLKCQSTGNLKRTPGRYITFHSLLIGTISLQTHTHTH